MGWVSAAPLNKWLLVSSSNTVLKNLKPVDGSANISANKIPAWLFCLYYRTAWSNGTWGKRFFRHLHSPNSHRFRISGSLPSLLSVAMRFGAVSCTRAFPGSSEVQDCREEAYRAPFCLPLPIHLGKTTPPSHFCVNICM